MSKYIKFLEIRIFLLISFSIIPLIEAQFSQFCLASDPVGNCLQCSEGFLVDNFGYCIPVCPNSFQYYSFVKKQCVFVCETGYQENSNTNLCEKILQCPQHISKGQLFHEQDIKGMRVYQDQWIVSFSSDKLIMWKVENSRIMLISNQYQDQNQIFEVQFSDDGQYFFSFSAKQVIIWSVSDFYQIATLNLREDDDIEIKQGFVKYALDSKQSFIQYFIGFSDSLHKIAVLIVQQARSFDQQKSSYDVSQSLKTIPIEEDIKSVEMFGYGNIYALSAQGNLLFWELAQDSPVVLANNILVLNLNLNFNLVQNNVKVFNGTAIELLSQTQFLIVNATSIGEQIIKYNQPKNQSTKFKQYTLNYYLNEIYLIDSQFIYIYNMTDSKYLIKQQHNLTIDDQPIYLQLCQQGNYFLIELNKTSYIFQRIYQGNYQGDSNQTSSSDFIFQGMIQGYQQIKTTNQELIWVSINNSIVAKQLVKVQNNSSSITDAFVLKNIAYEQIIVPRNDSQPQDLVYFDDFYVISFVQSFYIWSYKDHTLLYTINFDNPRNNFMNKLPNNQLLIFRDLSCSSLIFDCFSSIEIYQLGKSYAIKIQSVNNLKTDYYTEAVYMTNNILFILTSTQNLFMYTLSNQYQLINQSKIYATNTNNHNVDAESFFQQNYLINIFKSIAVIEAIDLSDQTFSSAFYKIKKNVQINSFFVTPQQQVFTLNLVNNTLLILQFNSSGFILLSQKDNLEERVLLSAYDMSLNRLIIIKGTQIVTYDESRKMVISKEWTPVYYQIAEKSIFIQTESIHIIAFQINRQSLVIFDIYSCKVLNTYEFYQINQLSFMKFNEKQNILHLTWVNKTHSYLQIENPFIKSLFQNLTQFDQLGFTSEIRQNFQANDIFFDQKTGVAVKIDYINKIIITLDIANETIIQIYFLEILSRDCFFIPKYGMIIFINKFTGKLFALYYYNSSKPIETQYLVEKSFVNFFSLNNIKPIITQDQNYLIYLSKQNLTQIDLSTMKIVNQVNWINFKLRRLLSNRLMVK
ncbi:hypothetical protein ABPG72_015637 [Tetrahymena utriculariae]